MVATTRDTRRLKLTQEATLGGEDNGDRPRALIFESWRRSLEDHVDPDLPSAAAVVDEEALNGLRSEHVIGPHVPLLRDTLRGFADQAAHLMVITEERGRVLWSEGPSEVRRQAERIGLVEGHEWAERAVGTNGIGTALATGAPVHVYAAEHFAHVLQDWSCSGAPITDPDTGLVVGCVDISATAKTLHPATTALVAAAARLAESQLALEMRNRDERLRERYLPYLGRGLSGPMALASRTGRILAATPPGWWGERVAIDGPAGTVMTASGRYGTAEPAGDGFLLRGAAGPGNGRAMQRLSLSLLGARTSAILNGRRLGLSLRHAEILALLVIHPAGLNGEQLSWHLYGDTGSPITVRAEIHRLRGQLGAVIAAKPYRLTCDVDADFRTVQSLLAGGDVLEAVRLYEGPLLPRSESPTIRAERDDLSAQLRARLLRKGDTDALWTYVQTEDGRHDLEVLERISATLPPDDPRRIAAQLREGRILAS